MKINRWGFLGVAVFFLAAVGGAAHSALWDKGDQVIRKIPTTHNVVALTFDDGPNYRVTPEILNVLKEKQVKATFFVLGSKVEQHPELVAQAYAQGHEIGSHAYSHRILNKLSKSDIEQELDKVEKLLPPDVPKPTLFRPPGGGWNDSIAAMAHARGYEVILWSIDTRDWTRPSVEQVVNAVFKDLKPGSIILFHDGEYPVPTPRALSIIIDGLRSRGYEMVTVSDLLQYYEVRH